jgi:hypothetical protein
MGVAVSMSMAGVTVVVSMIVSGRIAMVMRSGMPATVLIMVMAVMVMIMSA